MERPEQTDAQIREKARQAGLIEHFMIANLHGYRTVSMDTPNAAAILIAPNGAGKTTLIGALNAVLKGQFARLQNIDFDFIEIKLSNTNSHRIYKSDINNVVERSLSSEFISQASKYDIKPNQLFEYLLHAYNREEARQSYYNTTTLFDNIAKGEGYSLERALDVADRLTASLFAGSESLELVRSEIEESLRDIEILYLPTYRRIELSLAEDETYPHRRKRPDIKFSKDSLFSGTIQFGMADISDQLMKLNNEVLAESNEGYRRISAKIINDLERFSIVLNRAGIANLAYNMHRLVFHERKAAMG